MEVRMSTVELHEIWADEHEQVRLWRLEGMRNAGYTEQAAERLARRQDVDLHLAVDLLRRGCPPETALRILL
jgi:hypothetical protein